MLGQLDPQVSADLVSGLADFTLLLDASGCIRELSVNSDDLNGAINDTWVGQQLQDLVTVESRGRIDEMLDSAAGRPGTPASCDAAHPLEDGSELLVRYRAVRQGDDVLVLGQDKRAEASLRQQLVNAQQALEQDYWRLRQIETRYNRLFDMVRDAIIVVDGDSLRVIESNPQGAALLAPGKESIAGKPFPLGLTKAGSRTVRSLLEEARTAGRASAHAVPAEDTDRSFDIYATFLRQGNEARFLVRIGEHGVNGVAAGGAGGERLLGASLQSSPDAILVTDDDGRIIAANTTFLELAQVASEDQVLGQLADRWLGRSGVDLSVLLTNLRKNNRVKLFSTTLQGEQGSAADVEISASTIDGPAGRALAFFIRDVGRRVVTEHPSAAQLPRSIEQITKRVGRVPLKELVRESTDVIEALCIEAALELTHDNRASAAELLGLSRQSLYAKLRRYEIGGPTEEEG